MAKLVIGIAAFHAPGITARAEGPQGVRAKLYQNRGRFGAVLEEARLDVLPVVAKDHVVEGG